MLAFAALTPHPPIIIPEIGEDNTKFCQNTISAMEELSSRIEEHDIDTIIFISPHTTLSPQTMLVSYNDKASGSFASFGHPEIAVDCEIDLELAKDIIDSAQKEKLAVAAHTQEKEFAIDHGVLVPFHYLQKNLPSGVRMIIIGFSNQSRDKHLAFGKLIADVVKKSEKNVALIASGDMSHRILEEGSEFIGKKFDAQVVDNLKAFNPSALLKIDPYLQDEAGECGFRSLLILLGAVSSLNTQPEVLSYEAPFGVGYLITDFNLSS